MMISMQGYRRRLGTTNVHNHWQLETVKQMILPLEHGGNPEQFRLTFRIVPAKLPSSRHYSREALSVQVILNNVDGNRCERRIPQLLPMHTTRCNRSVTILNLRLRQQSSRVVG